MVFLMSFQILFPWLHLEIQRKQCCCSILEFGGEKGKTFKNGSFCRTQFNLKLSLVQMRIKSILIHAGLRLAGM